MPTRFWASRFPSGMRNGASPRKYWARLLHGRSSLQRPPTSAARVLQANMVQIWNWIFTPATMLAGIGIALLALGATAMGRDDTLNVQPWLVVVATAALATLVASWVAWQRPNLGPPTRCAGSGCAGLTADPAQAGAAQRTRPPVFWGRGIYNTVIPDDYVARTRTWLRQHSTLLARSYER
jgi:hypothetical protein